MLRKPHSRCIRVKNKAWKSPLTMLPTLNMVPIVRGGRERPPAEIGDPRSNAKTTSNEMARRVKMA